MKLNVKTFIRYFTGGLNILWKLGLVAIGVAAVFFTIFLFKEIKHSEMGQGKRVSN